MKQKHSSLSGYEKCIVINDIHIPFQDKKAIQLVFRFLRWFQPDRVIINGDLLDCQMLGKFLVDPFKEVSIIEEIQMGRAFLKELRAIVGDQCKIHYIFGN